MTLVLLATGHSPGTRSAGSVETAFGEHDRAQRDARLGDAAALHRPLRRRRLPHEPLQHRRRGPALRGRDPRRGGRARARRLAVGAAVDPGDDRRRARSAARRSRCIPGVLRAFLSTNEIITSLMLNYVAALVLDYLIFDSQSYWRDTSTPEREGLPAGEDPARRGDLAGRCTSAGSRSRSGSCSASRSPCSCAVLYTRTRFGFEVQVIGDSPRAATLRRHAHAAEDPRGDGAVGRDRRHRRREPGRRLPPPARPARADRGRLRLRRDRDRGARPLQPVRGRARRVPARRAAERRLRAAGRRLPVRARRRDAGADPLLRARRRAARPLPAARSYARSRRAAAAADLATPA